MTRVEFLPGVVEDLERILDPLQPHEAARRLDRLAELIRACEVLAEHPLIGRPLSPALHERVIGRGERGYVALYRYVAVLDTVFVLAIRAQREAGHARDA